MTFRIIILLVVTNSALFSQKEDHQWIFNWTSVDDCEQFGTFPEICGASILDFKSLPPRGYRNEEITLDFDQSNASICDDQGQLLLYSNCQAIHGPEHRAIENGDTINYSPRWDRLQWQNENDEWKPSGFKMVQGVVSFRNLILIPYLPSIITTKTIFLA